jgi:hypothetical protein
MAAGLLLRQNYLRMQMLETSLKYGFHAHA